MIGYLIKHRHRPYMLTTPITPFGQVFKLNQVFLHLKGNPNALIASFGFCFRLHFDSKTSILAISEKQNAVKMGINEKRDVRFVKNVVSRVI